MRMNGDSLSVHRSHPPIFSCDEDARSLSKVDSAHTRASSIDDERSKSYRCMGLHAFKIFQNVLGFRHCKFDSSFLQPQPRCSSRVASCRRLALRFCSNQAMETSQRCLLTRYETRRPSKPNEECGEPCLTNHFQRLMRLLSKSPEVFKPSREADESIRR